MLRMTFLHLSFMLKIRKHRIFFFSKHYIYTSKLKKQTPDISVFKRNFLNKLKIERFIGLQNNTLEEFENFWINLIELFHIYIVQTEKNATKTVHLLFSFSSFCPFPCVIA
jgi:hypothetical protein